MQLTRYLGHTANTVVSLIVVFSLGLALGGASMYLFTHKKAAYADDLVETRARGYHFIKPLMECDTADHTELQSFRDDVEKVVKQVVDSGYASHVSVYFRDLNNGPYFSINPSEDFLPASLLKVPLMITALKIAERDPAFLRRTIKIPADLPIDHGQYFPQREFMTPGGSYTVDELLYRMIVYSDNTATLIIQGLIPPGVDTQTFRELGVGFHEKNGKAEWLSVETYASFFRVLYNSTYLNREMSEKALALLSHSDLPRGLTNIAPQGVETAKKWGHSKRAGTEDSDQLHICGIVFYPDSPYLVCIMTRGNDLKNLSQALSEVSSAIYRHVDKQRGLTGTYSKL